MFLIFENYMLPCLNKKIFGMDCLGCGIQRATILVTKGEFTAAFKMYPAIYTLFLLCGFMLVSSIFKFKNATKITALLTIINIVIIVLSYILKINNLY